MTTYGSGSETTLAVRRHSMELYKRLEEETGQPVGFAFTGEGVKVSGVTPDSPAAAAGIQEGDVLMRIDDAPIADLRGYSDVLKMLDIGQTIVVVVLRDGVEVELSATLTAR